MPRIKTTTWPIEPHTEAKHAILKKYLEAWFPIISKYHDEIVYIDGFAGPGEYTNGNEGSPLIAIKTFLHHKVPITSKVLMYFIESDYNRCINLEKILSKVEKPSNLKIECINNQFNNVIISIMDKFSNNVPVFLFIDPFGFSGIPLNTIRRVMSGDKRELLINFMYEDIIRNTNIPASENHLSSLFGNDEWKEVRELSGPDRRRDFLYELYERQLETVAGIKYIRSFKMINRKNKTDYFLFFGTNNLIGLKKMKEAMWKVDETGMFNFSDVTHNPQQPLLFQKVPDYSKLKRMLMRQFRGKQIKIEELEYFIIVNTPFRETHYKNILKLMERCNPPEIKIISEGRRKRRYTYPYDCIVEFL